MTHTALAGRLAREDGTHGSSDYIRDADIRSALSPEKTGYNEMPLRRIWGSICDGSTVSDAWRAVGAKAVTGARGKFVDAWNEGDVSFKKALDDSDTEISRSVEQAYLLEEALRQRGDWGGCRR